MPFKFNIFTGTGAPNTAPVEVGHHYIDTASSKHYLSVGTSTSGDWVEVVTSASDTYAEIQVDGVAVSTNAPTLDFDSSDFQLTESPTDDFDITIKNSGIDHDATTNFVANEHIDHTAVTLTAGSGLSGGGDISASRTFNVDITSETLVTAATGDEVLIADASDSAAIKKTTEDLEEKRHTYLLFRRREKCNKELKKHKKCLLECSL